MNFHTVFLLLIVLIQVESFEICKCFKESQQASRGRRKNRIFYLSHVNKDISTTFSFFEHILFQRFSKAVSLEINNGRNVPSSYSLLIQEINRLTFTSSSSQVVNDRSKRMLVNLFPPGLLPAYKLLFGPLSEFSGIMNTWVTHWTTTWLMGPSKVESYQDVETSEIKRSQRLLVEKCRFLEESGCIKVCLHACKIPTQRFFYEEMGLPVTLTPNLTDYSCRFDFNRTPVKLEDDPSLTHPCFRNCTSSLSKNCHSQNSF